MAKRRCRSRGEIFEIWLELVALLETGGMSTSPPPLRSRRRCSFTPAPRERGRGVRGGGGGRGRGGDRTHVRAGRTVRHSGGDAREARERASVEKLNEVKYFCSVLFSVESGRACTPPLEAPRLGTGRRRDFPRECKAKKLARVLLPFLPVPSGSRGWELAGSAPMYTMPAASARRRSDVLLQLSCGFLQVLPKLVLLCSQTMYALQTSKCICARECMCVCVCVGGGGIVRCKIIRQDVVALPISTT